MIPHIWLSFIVYFVGVFISTLRALACQNAILHYFCKNIFWFVFVPIFMYFREILCVISVKFIIKSMIKKYVLESFVFFKLVFNLLLNLLETLRLQNQNTKINTKISFFKEKYVKKKYAKSNQ